MNIKLSKFLSCTLSSALLFSLFNYGGAEWNPAAQSPYAFGPEGRPIEDLQQFSKPNEMMSILPNRPIAARDKYGNRLYFSPSGKLSLRVTLDGKMEFSLESKSIEKDMEGNVLQQSAINQDTKMVEVKNDKGQIIAYQELGFGSKIVKEYDSQKNLTKSYTYDKYGKNTQEVLDELTQSKTIYGSDGKPMYDINFEGTQIAWYHFDQYSRVERKTDIRKNTTYFDKNGNMEYTEDQFHNITMRYKYITDDEGRFVLDTSVNFLGNITYFKDGKAHVEKTPGGEVLREYTYDGETLRYVFDTSTNQTTWYNLDGRPVYTTLNESLLKEWIYSKGKLIGLWDESNNSLTTYINEEETARYWIRNKPTPEIVQALIDSGYIKKQYIP